MHWPEVVVLPPVLEMLETESRVLMQKALLVLGSLRQPKRSVLFVMVAVGYYVVPKVLGVLASAAAQVLAARERDYSLEASLPVPVA